ncbi:MULTISPECIES: hypothetical protein [Cyanophyceae]|uniref:hypothetical protein n=1 Tax=Cyanophyceae TaxID=3028117 RepID=UPI00168986AA|nr:hypothetical protein [Trichocoleus sp. FACHB-40]MBD2001706.1 hypothetical protein [Trichocoleus sp. FACHB-40]
MEYTAHTIQKLSWQRSQFIFSRLIRLLLKRSDRTLQEQRRKVEAKLAGCDLRDLRDDLCL